MRVKALVDVLAGTIILTEHPSLLEVAHLFCPRLYIQLTCQALLVSVIADFGPAGYADDGAANGAAGAAAGALRALEQHWEPHCRLLSL